MKLRYFKNIFKFRLYIQIQTMVSVCGICSYKYYINYYLNVCIEPCVAFLKRQAESLNLSFNIYYPVHRSKPVVVLTWLGSNPATPSIVLNSHMDVVPVFEEVR